MISTVEIEQRRTSDQLKTFVKDVRKRIESCPGELRRAQNGEGRYREFINEVWPLSQFAHLLYPPGTLFLPVLGNQGYDVEVFDEEGEPLDKIEIAKPHDGQANAENNRLLNERRVGHIRVCDFGGQLDALKPWIASTAENKSLKDYSDCTLVLVALTDPPFDEELPILEQRCIEFVQRLKQMAYRAKRAFLAVPSLDKCFEIQG
ncbi:hypothetical protein [Marinobacter sp. X15-166B]|uniref:hypothetical protein n=1 Tax=Marinobacter sp. X15-166B TaxID=1897620 RepID=UPI00085C0446|nr:hypothetical protein [Marinobacter sp. X15-166B]OEY67516.1 hypothetical protein BG841_14460 [Marinobacter sp. X15-166B]